VTKIKADILKSTEIVNLEAGWAAVDLDEHTRPAEVQLLSLHNNVVNLQVDGWKHLLFIAGPNLEAGPATICLGEDDFALFKDYIAIKKGGFYQCSTLSINSSIDKNSINKRLELNWRKSSRKSFAPLFLGKPNRLTVKKTLHDYRCLLTDIKTVGSTGVLLKLPGGEDYFRRQIVENFPSLVEALLHNNRNKFKRYAKKIIGLGRGLTPAGDDLLHGLLITYRCFVNRDGLREPVKHDLHILAENTNLFGRHMIETGLKGLTPEVFNIFLNTIFEGKADRSLLKRIGAIGSSSGYDIAIAMIVSLNKIFV